MYCHRCGIVLDTSEQRIGYCRKCDVPRLLEEVRDQMRGTPGVNMPGKIFINGVEQYPNNIIPAPKIIIDGIEQFPPLVNQFTSCSHCLVG